MESVVRHASKGQRETIAVRSHSHMMGNNITRVQQGVPRIFIGVQPQLTTTKMDSGIFAQVSQQGIVSQASYRMKLSVITSTLQRKRFRIRTGAPHH